MENNLGDPILDAIQGRYRQAPPTGLAGMPPMSDLMMNQNIVPRQPGPEYNVRAQIPRSDEAGRAMLGEMLEPDRGMSAMDRFKWIGTPSGGLEMAANIFGGPALRGKMSSMGMSKGAGRANAGGETGVNNYFYAGGQFLPNTEAPPGTWRIKAAGKAQNLPNGQELIAPGSMAPRPSPFSRSVFQSMGGGTYVDIGADGIARVNPNVNWGYLGTTPEAKQPVRFKNLGASKEEFSTNDLVEMYNKGVRWIDTEPLPGVEIVAKGDILKRYGLAGLPAAGAVSQQLSQGTEQ